MNNDVLKKYHDSYKDICKSLEISLNLIERHGFTDNVNKMLEALKDEAEATYLSLAGIYEEEQYLQYIEAQAEMYDEMRMEGRW